MKAKSLAYSLLSLLIALTMSRADETLSSLDAKVEQSVKTISASLKEERRETSGNRVTRWYEPGIGRLAVSTEVFPGKAEAHATLEKTKLMVTAEPQSIALGPKVDAWCWTDATTKACVVVAQKGNVMVQFNGPSNDAVVKVATELFKNMQ